ncbi:maleylpyruvate isomerase family mycothiol-dependent enzyme [Streptomyces sp. NPDC020917]|uniref:maleylpyruvate isomerase family mycothiol-dependent enzyme n=1 Tax=Streptomyces sp. NPDC020917 TaxID=3365102 RepID=UPI0037A25F37
MTRTQEFDPAAVLERLSTATAALLHTAASLDDADVRAPSLLPGWTRAHVLTHLARNADGGTNLLVWARTGVETPEYPSMEARARAIEDGAGRPARALLADVRDSADRFAAEYARMPDPAWETVVRWTGGQQRPAARAADSRLTEVLVHHADLDTAYTCAQWPADFVAEMLGRVTASFSGRADAPAMRLHATDTGTHHSVPHPPPDGSPLIRAPQADLLSWLMGRPPTPHLTTHNPTPLPHVPFLY